MTAKPDGKRISVYIHNEDDWALVDRAREAARSRRMSLSAWIVETIERRLLEEADEKGGRR